MDNTCYKMSKVQALVLWGPIPMAMDQTLFGLSCLFYDPWKLTRTFCPQPQQPMDFAKNWRFFSPAPPPPPTYWNRLSPPKACARNLHVRWLSIPSTMCSCVNEYFDNLLLQYHIMLAVLHLSTMFMFLKQSQQISHQNNEDCDHDEFFKPIHLQIR
jgi:hypothetical protein